MTPIIALNYNEEILISNILSTILTKLTEFSILCKCKINKKMQEKLKPRKSITEDTFLLLGHNYEMNIVNNRTLYIFIKIHKIFSNKINELLTFVT